MAGRASEGEEQIWEASLLRRVPFPGRHDLWVLIDRGGQRREARAARGRGPAARAPLLVPLELRVRRSRARHPELVSLESGFPELQTDPARFAMQQWVAELVDLALPDDDPHPLLLPLLDAIGARAHRPDAVEWGLAARTLGEHFGVWTPPERCPGCGAPPDGRPALRAGCADCWPCGERRFVEVELGGWRLPLVRLLDSFDAVWQESFLRAPRASGLLRELGRRGLLS